MVKRTNGFQQDIKNYDLLRRLLRHIYLYGDYGKSDFVKNHIIKSERSFYDMIKRIEAYIDDGYLQRHTLPDRKKDKEGYRIAYDPFSCPFNYLADTYQHCSYVAEDLLFFVLFYQSFRERGDDDHWYDHTGVDVDPDMGFHRLDTTFTKENITETLWDILRIHRRILEALGQAPTTNTPTPEAVLTRSKISSRIDQLVSLGGIEKVDSDHYRLTPDIFEGLTDDELRSLQTLTGFFYNSTDFAIPGYFLAGTLEQYAIANGRPAEQLHFTQKNPLFYYQNNNLQNILDDDVLWSLVLAMDARRPVQYTYRNRHKHERPVTAYVIKLVAEHIYGRHYAFVYDYDRQNYTLHRLDCISHVMRDERMADPLAFLGPCDDVQAALDALYHERMDKAWNVTQGKSTKTVVLHFTCLENMTPRQLTQQIRTATQRGKIEKTGPRTFDFTIAVASELEMIPWIRSFGPAVAIDKTANPRLWEACRKDREEVLRLYGAF